MIRRRFKMSKILVAYFSASGVTKKVAERMAKAVGADLYEIVPEVPYTAEDVNYRKPFARCNKEWFKKLEVPAAGNVPDFDRYELVLIGFPIWYGCAPIVVHCFADKHDFTGKKVGLFATSISSKMGKTAAKFEPHMKGKGELRGDRRILPEDSDEAIAEWVNSL